MLKYKSKIQILTIILLFWSITESTYGQTIIKGVVFDGQSNEPLPYVNVVFRHSTVGTITDINGNYHISTNNPKDTLVASCLGYELDKANVIPNTTQEINFKLSPSTLSIGEIVVTPGENPAFRILDNIKENRKRNNPDRFQSYQYKTYNKLRLDINNIDQNFKDQRLMKQFQFVFDNMDSSEVFGKNYLPILISESVSNFYYQKSPSIEKEIIEAFKISGIENNTISQFSGKMYQRLNVYDNFISLFEPGFVSPIADFGRMYYKYYLEDSASIDGSWCYKISFKPKREKERTFYGYFWVADTAWALKKIQLRVSSDVNINFMNDLVAINEYQKVNDSIWFLLNEDLFIDFNITDESYGFFGRKQASYQDIILNEPIPEEISKLRTNTYIDEETIDKEDEYWEENRIDPLDKEEADIYEMVDSVKQVPMFKTIYSIVEMMVGYYYVAGKYDIGPYHTFYSYNPIEGHRIKFGARTNQEFSQKYRFGGHVAYGFGDQKVKYGINTQILINRNPRRNIKLSYLNDMQQLGKSPNAFLDDNILSTILRRRPNYKLTMVERTTFEYENEWFQGFTNTFKIENEKIYSSEYIPFHEIISDIISTDEPFVSTTEFTLSTHFAYKEKFILGRFERKSLGSQFPILDLHITYAPMSLLNNKYEYLRLSVQVKDKIETNPFGYLRYWATAGKIFGKTPYPFLELHEGNETYAYDIYAFNMMNYYEFASDEFVSFFAEQHLQGFFLNRIPLLRKLEWREVASAKFLAGRLTNQNRNVMEFPEGLNPLGIPYLEAGVGIENIFKLFRVEATWRLTHLDNPDIQIFGLRAMMQITF